MTNRSAVGTRSTTWPPAPGRVARFLEKHPFWDRVVSSVVSTLIATFVITWIASSIAIISLGEDGSPLQWSGAAAWTVLFLAFGVCLGIVALFLFLLFDGRRPHQERLWRVMSGAMLMVWIIAWGASPVLPEEGAVVVGVLLALTSLPCLVLPLAALQPSKTSRSARLFRRLWRPITMAGVVLGVVAVLEIGSLLAGVHGRATNSDPPEGEQAVVTGARISS